LIAAAVDLSGGAAVAGVVRRMFGRPPAWRDRRALHIDAGGASVGAIDFESGAREAEGAMRDGHLLVAVDARFDEKAALRASLGLSDDAGDAMLVAAAYRHWGVGFARHLSGDFAVVLWDGATRRLLAARDPFGVRPLYLARAAGSCYLASDTEALLATGRVATEPDDDVVVGYLQWTITEPERTFFRDIRRVRPGHTLVVTETSSCSTDHRVLSTSTLNLSDRQACWNEYRRLFFQSVRRRLASTKPVVVHLSGGLDSTAITIVADSILRSGDSPTPAVVAAGATHPGLPCDESAYIQAVAAAVALPVETWDGTQADALELDATPPSVPGGRYTMTGGTEGDAEVARRLRGHVVLSGTGGDQLGVPSGATEDAVVEGRWRQAFLSIYGTPGPARWKVRRALQVAKALSPQWLQAFHRSARSEERTAAWLTPWAANLATRRPAPEQQAIAWTTHVQRYRWAQLTGPRMVASLEAIQQRALRTGLETRFPFLDWDLARFVLGIPSRFFPPPWPQERLHREALGDLLPDRVRQRRTKAQFSSALARRVTAQIGRIHELCDASASSAWQMGRYVQQSQVRRSVITFQRSTFPTFATTWAVWGCVSVEAWLRACNGYTPGPWEADY
jgi:asparagine synthase (glutamine-hydrolysing)